MEESDALSANPKLEASAPQTQGPDPAFAESPIPRRTGTYFYEVDALTADFERTQNAETDTAPSDLQSVADEHVTKKDTALAESLKEPCCTGTRTRSLRPPHLRRKVLTPPCRFG